MATREMAAKSAQYMANRTGKAEVFYRVKNGQWMTASLDWFRANEPGTPDQRATIVSPDKAKA